MLYKHWVTVHASDVVLNVVDGNILLIVGDPQRILD
jgi:hypothetical protein